MNAINSNNETYDDNLEYIKALQVRYIRVLQGLVKIVSPNFSVEELSLLSKKIQSLEVAELLNMRLCDRRKFEALIEKIEANNDFQRADALTNPKTGVIKMQIDEVMPMYQKANEDMNKIAALAGFKGLYKRKYGTEIYPHKGISKFLNIEYLEDWKNSDNICAALGEKDFVDVIYKFDEAKRISSELKTLISDLTEQERKINGMVEEHKNAKISLQNLDSDYNKKIGMAVIDYVKTTDKNNLQAFTNSYKGTEELLTALDGIEHQIEHLKQVNEQIKRKWGIVLDSGRVIILD